MRGEGALAPSAMALVDLVARPMSSVGMSVEAKPTAAEGAAVRAPSVETSARIRRIVIGLALPVGLAAAWEIAVRAGLSDGRLVPPPSRIYLEFEEDRKSVV